MVAIDRLIGKSAISGLSARGENVDLVAATAEQESIARSYPVNVPVAFAGAEGHYLIALDGTRYLDLLTGAGVMLLGHNHPNVVAALCEATQPILSGLDLVTAPKAAFLETFRAILPGNMADRVKVQFCGPTGADAVETALKLARLATGRSGIFAFCGSYHGMTQGALAVTADLRVRRAGLRVRDEVTFLPFPYPFRHRVKDPDLLSEQCLDHMRMLLEDDQSGVDRPGVVLIEAVQGEGATLQPRQASCGGCGRFVMRTIFCLRWTKFKPEWGEPAVGLHLNTPE